MTDTLREIEKGYEAKYKLDEELRFKVRCRRNKLLGLWAAEQMRLSGADADAYAKSLIRLELDKPGVIHAVRQVASDFFHAGVNLGEQDISHEATRCEALAFEQLSSAFPTALDSDHVQVGG
jgi:hypothetical protein